jgi:sugar-specific transcriptional regulator TrmB
MAEEAMKNVLKNLQLTEKEAEVYIFLSKHGVLKCSEVARGMKRHRAQIYRILRILQSKGLLEETLEAPTRFAVVSFERVLDLRIRAKRDEAAQMENAKNEMLAYWKSVHRPELELDLEKFVVIEGNNKIYPKIAQMINDTKNQFSEIATVTDFLRADQFGLFDSIFVHSLKSKINFRFITDISNQNMNPTKKLLKSMHNTNVNLRARSPLLGFQLSPRIIIRDGEEALFFITPRNVELGIGHNEVGLWTDCRELVLAFAGIFEEMWRTASDVGKKIVDTEIDSLSEARMIEDDEEAKHTYKEMLSSADKEILLITSSRGLKELWQNTGLLNEAIQRGVSIRIMAPIIDEIQDTVKQLAKRAQVRHVAIGDIGTTIIDGRHLFQFKDMPIDQDMFQPMRLGKAYYSNDFEYVNKMKTTMEDIWMKAPVPSCTMWELSFGSSIPRTQFSNVSGLKVTKVDRPVDAGENTAYNVFSDQTEKLPSMEYVKERRQYYDRTKETIVAYGWRARTIVRLPNLPSTQMIGINVIHLDDNSAFGGGKMIEVALWTETPRESSFVPVACLVNPQGAMVMKHFYEGTPAAGNLVLVEPHKQVEIFRKDNLVFAGWTVNIPLPPLNYSLGPSCLYFEGYGPAQQLTRSYAVPAGYKGTVDFKKRNAFVTFMHQPQPYIATGIQGTLITEYVMRTTRS